MDASLNLEGGIHCFMQHSAIREPGFHLVGVHVVAAGKQLHHSKILLNLILVCGYSNQCRQTGGGFIVSNCAKLQWELTITRGVSDFDIEHRQFGNKYIVQYREFQLRLRA